jgi:hypothetical protein
MIEIWLRPLARPDPTESVPDAQLELRAVLGERQVEVGALAGEVLVELALHVGERAVVGLGLGVEAVAVGVERGQAAGVGGDIERADRAGEESGGHAPCNGTGASGVSWGV